MSPCVYRGRLYRSPEAPLPERPSISDALSQGGPRSHVGRERSAVGRRFFFRRQEAVETLIYLLPLYSLKAAAGYFGNAEPVEPEGWVEADGAGRLDKRMFVCRAVGRSMEPRIHDGDYVVFRAKPAGTRQGKIVLVQYRGAAESGHGRVVHRQALLVGEGGLGGRRLAPRSNRAVTDQSGVRADRLFPGGERACGGHRGDGDGAAGRGVALWLSPSRRWRGPSGTRTGSTIRCGRFRKHSCPGSTGRSERIGGETSLTCRHRDHGSTGEPR